MKINENWSEFIPGPDFLIPGVRRLKKLIPGAPGVGGGRGGRGNRVRVTVTGPGYYPLARILSNYKTIT